MAKDKKPEAPPTEVYVETPVIPDVKMAGMPSDFLELLKHVVHIARSEAKPIAAKVNPTNIFVLRLEAIAQAAEDYMALCEERGHRGLPE